MYFEIQAQDPERAATFYRQVFGWTFTRVDTVPFYYWRIQAAGDLIGGLQERDAGIPGPTHGTNAFVCLFEVDDFDGTAAAINEAGGAPADPAIQFPRVGRQQYFFDTEGNKFGIYVRGRSTRWPKMPWA